jgi:hypothetical protein
LILRIRKHLPDFTSTAKRLGIAIVDITELKAVGNKLHFRNAKGRLVPIHRIYNRAIADELIGRGIRLPFDLTHPWDVEWAGHPNWYFLISKFSVPWLSSPSAPNAVVPPAVFLDEFLEGPGRAKLAAAGVPLPTGTGPDTVYNDLLLKPLFSFAGKGIQFDPTQSQLEAIPAAERSGYLLQQRMSFVPTIDTPARADPGRVSHPIYVAGRREIDPGNLSHSAGKGKNDGCGSQQESGVGGCFGGLLSPKVAPLRCRET